jgi:hypothetical protein
MPGARREPTLTLRALNRATLARQMLLAREPIAVTAAIERLVGLQAQLPRPPFIGLWSRVAGFRRADLVDRIERREVVRATMMRGTLHLATARDYNALRATIQPALTQGMRAILRQRADDLDIDRLVATAHDFFAAKPQTFDALRPFLAGRSAGGVQGEAGDVRAQAYAVRMNLPLVQTPAPGQRWAYPAVANFAVADAWTGRAIDGHDRPEVLVKRYLAAFGPATVTDVQTWSGHKGLKDVVAAMRPELTVVRDDRGRELVDLPDAPRPDPDTPAPHRFLPEFDNVLLSHADRTRILANAHRPAVFLPALRVRATFLVDGFVSGTWSVRRTKARATLVVEPFAKIPKKTRDELAAEGDQLLRFVEEDATSFTVEFASS